MIRIKMWFKTTLKKFQEFLVVTAEHSRLEEMSNFYGYPKERYDSMKRSNFERRNLFL